jgi:hypothetical protein
MAGTTNTALSLVKQRLNRLAADTSLDDYFTQRIAAAEAELAGVGISLTDSADDLMLLVDYTVWQYQNRDSAGSMPDWLRLRRRERWLRQTREASGDDS